MKPFKFIEKMIVRLNMAVMILSLSIMVVLGFIQVILRNFFESGLPWADILIRSLVLWLGFTGAVVATSRGRHIAIGALVRFVPSTFKRVAHFIVSIFTAFVCALLVYASYNFIKFEMEMGSTLAGLFPLWISELIIPSTFVFLSYQFLLHAFDVPPAEEEQI